MVHNAHEDTLDVWPDAAEGSLLGAFAYELRRDQSAVDAALRKTSSNGQTEQRAFCLKTLK